MLVCIFFIFYFVEFYWFSNFIFILLFSSHKNSSRAKYGSSSTESLFDYIMKGIENERDWDTSFERDMFENIR